MSSRKGAPIQPSNWWPLHSAAKRGPGRGARLLDGTSEARRIRVALPSSASALGRPVPDAYAGRG